MNRERFNYKNRTIIQLLLILCTITCIICNFQANSAPSFEEYLVKYGKHYEQNQIDFRRQLYIDNLKKLEEKQCTSCGVNNFTDWTQEEKKRLRVLKVSDKRSNRAGIRKVELEQPTVRILQSLPESFNWVDQGSITAVRHQGSCGASFAFSVVAFFQHDAIVNFEQSQSLDLSQEYVLDCDEQSNFCHGGDADTAMDFILQRGGIPRETTWPYIPFAVHPGICQSGDQLLVNVSKLIRKSFYDLKNQQLIEQQILNKPLIVSVCSQDFQSYSPTNGNLTLKCDPKHKLLDHTALLVGYTKTEWIVKNSWGQDWGVNGYAYISRSANHDCCVGEQLHMTGQITQTCQIQNCAVCVDEHSCFQCESGMWVYHNPFTNEQTCKACEQDFCQKCQDYDGECQQCQIGYTFQYQIQKCVQQTVAFCSFMQLRQCQECHSGYRLSFSYSTGITCIPKCDDYYCLDCSSGNCTQCRQGYGLMEQNGTQTCQLNPCSVQDCAKCDSEGNCVECDIFLSWDNTTQTCISSCSIQNCLKCVQGYWQCYQCADGLSFNYWTQVCEEFPIQNCNLHDEYSCYICNDGYEAIIQSYQILECKQECKDWNCRVCNENNTDICQECEDGYTLKVEVEQQGQEGDSGQGDSEDTTDNGNANQYSCELNQCTIPDCAKCDFNNTICYECDSYYEVFDETTLTCETNCTLDNCLDCRPEDTHCDRCQEGYLPEYETGECLENPFEHCVLIGYYYGVLECWACQTNYKVNTTTWLSCELYCYDYYCESCQLNNTIICNQCVNGYALQFSRKNPGLHCAIIQPLIPFCWLSNKQQTYCYFCHIFYHFNEQTQLCQPTTQGCAEHCSLCFLDQFNNNTMVYCQCEQGYLYDPWELECVQDILNIQGCSEITFFGGQASCYYCIQGYYNDYDFQTDSYICYPECLVDNCQECYFYYNQECYQCQEGYMPTDEYKCQKCQVDHCNQCETAECLACEIGYQLDAGLNTCIQIVCDESNGQELDGDNCLCSQGYYQLSNGSCAICSTQNCITCWDNVCDACQAGYYLNAQNTCSDCMTNCLDCTQSTTCSECKEGYFFETEAAQCIQNSEEFDAYVVLESDVTITCSTGCLSCMASGVCSSCKDGYALNSAKECKKCEGNCKGCYSNIPSTCKSCYSGYSLNSSKCVACSDSNCLQCQSLNTVCTKCVQGQYVDNSACVSCPQNCQSCDGTGVCLTCKDGFAIVSDLCEPCIQKCGLCSSTAIQECISCKKGSYKDSNSQCISCPSNCKTCTSSSSCQTCNTGYIIRFGVCHLPCHTGCKTCGADSEVCSKCFGGYSLSASNKCAADVSCNTDSSCVACPIGYALQSSKCIQCTTLDTNCIQCKTSDVSVCAKCSKGYYLDSLTCKQCDSSCSQCKTLELCSVCSDGFYLSTSTLESTGKCKSCSDSCKTCQKLSDVCTSCKTGFLLIGTGNCVNQQQIDATIVLNMAISEYSVKSRAIRLAILAILGPEFQKYVQNIIIKALTSGSTIVSTSISVPQGENADTAYQNLANTNEIAGVGVTSVSNTLSGDTTDDSADGSTDGSTEDSAKKEEQSGGSIGIIVGAAVGAVVVVGAIVAIVCYKKRAGRYGENQSGKDRLAETQKSASTTGPPSSASELNDVPVNNMHQYQEPNQHSITDDLDYEEPKYL